MAEKVDSINPFGELPAGYKRPFVRTLRMRYGPNKRSNCMVCELDISFWKHAKKMVVSYLADYMKHRDEHLPEESRAKHAALVAEVEEMIKTRREDADDGRDHD